MDRRWDYKGSPCLPSKSHLLWRNKHQLFRNIERMAEIVFTSFLPVLFDTCVSEVLPCCSCQCTLPCWRLLFIWYLAPSFPSWSNWSSPSIIIIISSSSPAALSLLSFAFTWDPKHKTFACWLVNEPFTDTKSWKLLKRVSWGLVFRKIIRCWVRYSNSLLWQCF